MKSADLPEDESDRLKALLSYDILDTGSETAYDDLTKLAATLCDAPISLVSLIDTERQWFKSRQGLDAQETPRDLAFCAHAILQQEVFVVPDTLEDERFLDNPLVTGAPHIRFYAGAPLVTPEGHALGTLCVIDTAPRTLPEDRKDALAALARQVVSQFELRRNTEQLRQVDQMRRRLLALLSHDVKSSLNVVLGFAQVMSSRLDRMSKDEVRSHSDKIVASGRRAIKLLQAVLEWSRQQLDGESGEPAPSNVASAAQEALTLVEEHALTKNVTLDFDADPESVRAPHCLLVSALHNLLSNAVKFSHHGGEVRLRTERKGKQLWITIADDGIGMDQQEAEELYRAGAEHSRTGTDGERGTGLGTLLVGDFVTSHGGKLEVHTAVDEGFTVAFSLPLAE